jgi:hypothetical protein
VGLYCGIYKSSYNVSNILYLNSPPPPKKEIFLMGLTTKLEWDIGRYGDIFYDDGDLDIF